MAEPGLSQSDRSYREAFVVVGRTDPAILEPCARCGHLPDWHRLDDSLNLDPTDPETPFRCIGYDCTAPGPVPSGGRACDCPDYVP